MQRKKPEDLVIATGKQYSVEDFAKEAFKYVGLDYKNYIKINRSLIRPSEVDSLLGNSYKAKKILKWKPSIDFKTLVADMVQSDLNIVSKQGY